MAIAPKSLTKTFQRALRSQNKNTNFGHVRYFSNEISKKNSDIAKPKPTQEWSWGWTPPTNAKLVSGEGGGIVKSISTDYQLPVVVGEWLEVEEICEALTYLGGIDVSHLEIDERIDSVDYMVFCTGRSPAHLRRLADVLVRCLKKRGLKHAPGFTGAEGYDCDDWIIVDTGNILVQLLDSHTRRCLNLEHLWSSPDHALRVDVGGTEEEVEAYIDELVANNPVPEDYNSKDVLITGTEASILSGGRSMKWGVKPTPQLKGKGRKGGKVRGHANF